MTSRILIAAACFAFAAACQPRKTICMHPCAEPKPQTQEEGKREGDEGAKAAAVKRSAPKAAAVKRSAPKAAEPAEPPLFETASADEDTIIGEKEAPPPEPEEDATLEAPVEALGTEVTARVENIDRKRNQVVFTLQDDISEIRLQSGKEIKVPFNDLRLLTGLEKEKAIKVLVSADDLKVRVLGMGDAMRIVEIELPEEEMEEPVRGEDSED